jgi:mobilome CxxCx(11)CxxC protein
MTEQSLDATEVLRKECWRKRFYSFGTAKVFEKRVLSLGRRRRLITFLGLASPLFLGAFVAAYSTESAMLKLIVIPTVAVLSIVQALLSLWSLVFAWDHRYACAVTAVKNNTRLASDFEDLATAPDGKLDREIERLRFEYARQEGEDSAQEISEKEKRFGERSSLFQYQSKCPACGEVPTSMKPTNCDACGNFGRKTNGHF